MSWFYAKVRLRDPDCPVARSPDLPAPFRCLDPGPGGTPVGRVEGPTPEGWTDLGGGPAGQVVRTDRHDCAGCPIAGECEPDVLATVRAVDGNLDLGVPADDRAELRSLVAALRERGQDPAVVRIESAGADGGAGSALTDRQRAVLQAATDADYFSPSSAVTLEEVAEEVGGSTSTVHEHLQKGLDRLLGERFG